MKPDCLPELMARAFCDMDAEEQARFFDEVWNISRSWDGSLMTQMVNVIRCGKVKDGWHGDCAMDIIGMAGETVEKFTDGKVKKD